MPILSLKEYLSEDRQLLFPPWQQEPPYANVNRIGINLGKGLMGWFLTKRENSWGA